MVLTPTCISGADDSLCSISDLKLVKDIGEVVAYCLGAEYQVLRNLCVVMALGE